MASSGEVLNAEHGTLLVEHCGDVLVLVSVDAADNLPWRWWHTDHADSFGSWGRRQLGPNADKTVRGRYATLS